MKRKPPKRQPVLLRLVEFLNRNTNRPESRVMIPNVLVDGRSDSFRSRAAKEAKAVQGELREDVQRLLYPPPIPSAARAYRWATSPAEFWLRSVVDKIDAIDFLPAFNVARWPNPLFANRTPLRLGGEQFFVLYAPALADEVRASAYWTLGETLRSSEFAMLRRCGGCLMYFIAGRSDKQTCSRKCSRAYQNKIRSANGTFKKYRTHKKREQAKGDKDSRALRRKAEALYQDTIYGDLQKRDLARYNQIQREVGGGDDVQGWRELTKWWNAKLPFSRIDDRNRAIFVKACEYRPVFKTRSGG